jgi:hypothetical protein
MRTKFGPCFLCICAIVSHCEAQKTYAVISKKTAQVNPAVINQLPPNLKALAAYYSAIGGTQCRQQACRLTTALGLGNQGSPQQITLIQKYFPDDKVAKMICGQNCYLPPDSSAAYSNFVYLTFVISGENIKVNYQLAVYDRGHTKMISGPDTYTFQNQVFKEKKRVLYSWVDK